jgi:hypothetical protein
LKWCDKQRTAVVATRQLATLVRCKTKQKAKPSGFGLKKTRPGELSGWSLREAETFRVTQAAMFAAEKWPSASGDAYRIRLTGKSQQNKG